MPSFDVVSEIEQQELTNAIDQANREISTRFDFKGTDSKIDLNEWVLTIVSKSEFQIKQINDSRTIGNCILDKTKQDPKLKKDYTKKFELD